MSVSFVAVVIVVCLIFDRRNDRALVGVDLYIEDLGPADDSNVIDPGLLGVLILGVGHLAIGVLYFPFSETTQFRSMGPTFSHVG